jgi:hypothetical protein
MSSAGNGEQPYQLSISGAVAGAIRYLMRRAAREGRGTEFLLALRRVIEQLRHNPSGFGEPLYRLPALRMQVRSAVVRPLWVDFGVCEDRPLVFIKIVKLLSKQGS